MSVGHRPSMPLEKQGYMKENKMIHQHLSSVIPFYNPPYEAFKACLENIDTEVISLEQSEYCLKLAMLNFHYGAKARYMLKTHIKEKLV